MAERFERRAAGLSDAVDRRWASYAAISPAPPHNHPWLQEGLASYLGGHLGESPLAVLASGDDVLDRWESVLAALEAGLPDCAGVTLGIDRLIMVSAGQREINQVLSFPFAFC